MSKKAVSDKVLQEQQAIGEIYKQYIDTFQETGQIKRKAFVKSEVLYPGGPARPCGGQPYSPRPAARAARAAPRPAARAAPRKSNLRLLGDELKLLQRERRAQPAPASTNLFLSHLAADVTEARLAAEFGAFGALASVKVMWPRGPAGGRAHCGFVAFMRRGDAARALRAAAARADMRASWGRPVRLPAAPMRPAVVRVVAPADRARLALIHRMVEFVTREGPHFEEYIMKLEAHNAEFGFLRDYRSAEHAYYRWRLYSVLNGDLVGTTTNDLTGEPAVAPLSDEIVNKLGGLIRHVTMARDSIAVSMTSCLKMADNLNDFFALLFESLLNLETHPLKKTARIFLLSDLLINCKRKQLTFDEDLVRERVSEVFKQFHEVYNKLAHAQDKECLKLRILKLIRAWNSWKVFDLRYVCSLESTFLFGLDNGEEDGPLDGATLLKAFNKSTSDCCIVKADKFVDIFALGGGLNAPPAKRGRF